MNFPAVDSIIGRQRCRQWIPLITQQLRLRHLYQVTAYNIVSGRQGSFYFTLHLTTLSAPFYTSEKINTPNPKWSELEFSQNTPLSMSGIVLRIWQHQGSQEKDIIISTWGIHFSGLAYVGSKLSEIQPSYFKENSIILHMRGGYFTSLKAIRTDLTKPLPFIDQLNIVSTEDETKIIKNTGLNIATAEVKTSYDSSKLQKLHFLQISIRNKTLDSEILREKIDAKCGVDEKPGDSPNPSLSTDPSTSTSPPVRYATQLLTMNSLNKMLQEKPTRGQKKEIIRVNKAIEIARWRTKLLTKEKNQKIQHIRQLKQKYTQLYELNEERESELMDNYRTLSKDVEKLRDWRKEQIQQREDLMHLSSQLYHRKRQLISQLLYIYPICQLEINKYFINGVYLPDSDLLTDCSDAGLSVALGYVSHILTMCASFLQVPLRYPVVHWGSRSYIVDHISPSLTNDKEREFPLYTKGKDRMQFNYAVYLLNKNIAQLRLLCGLQTLDLRATLPNLLSFLQGKEQKEIGPALAGKLEILSQKMKREENQTLKDRGDEMVATKLEENGFDSSKEKSKILPDCHGTYSLSSSPNVPDPVLDMLRHQCLLEHSYTPVHRPGKKVKSKTEEGGPGLSEILAIPEAYLNRQISSTAFKAYMSTASSTYMSCSSSTENTGEIPIPSRSSSKSSTKSNTTMIKTSSKLSDKICDIKVGKHNNQHNEMLGGEVIEQGTDLLDPELNLKTGAEKIEVYTEQPVLRTVSKGMDITTKQKRKSRSVGSYTDEERDLRPGLELGSDPVINTSIEEAGKSNGSQLNALGLPCSLEDHQSEFLQKWLDSGPALVCSEENLYPEEILGTVAHENGENPLTVRTDALLSTTSFNLVKPKY